MINFTNFIRYYDSILDINRCYLKKNRHYNLLDPRKAFYDLEIAKRYFKRNLDKYGEEAPICIYLKSQIEEFEYLLWLWVKS